MKLKLFKKVDALIFRDFHWAMHVDTTSPVHRIACSYPYIVTAAIAYAQIPTLPKGKNENWDDANSKTNFWAEKCQKNRSSKIPIDY